MSCQQKIFFFHFHTPVSSAPNNGTASLCIRHPTPTVYLVHSTIVAMYILGIYNLPTSTCLAFGPGSKDKNWRRRVCVRQRKLNPTKTMSVLRHVKNPSISKPWLIYNSIKTSSTGEHSIHSISQTPSNTGTNSHQSNIPDDKPSRTRIRDTSAIQRTGTTVLYTRARLDLVQYMSSMNHWSKPRLWYDGADTEKSPMSSALAVGIFSGTDISDV